MAKVYVETSSHLLEGIDEMVREGYYANRAEAVNEAISMMLKQYKIAKLHAKDSGTWKHTLSEENIEKA